jgi:hypothetical protein
MFRAGPASRKAKRQLRPGTLKRVCYLSALAKIGKRGTQSASGKKSGPDRLLTRKVQLFMGLGE